MKNAMKHIMIALMTLAFPLALIFEMTQIATGSKDGSILANLLYLLAWGAFMGALFWLMQKPDLPAEEKAIMVGKRTQSIRYAIEALRRHLYRDDHQHQ